MKMKRICFIDDSRTEIHRFEKHFGNKFSLFTGTSFEEATSKLDSNQPDLIVLDLYFQYKPKKALSLVMLKDYWKIPTPEEVFTKNTEKLLENTWGVVIAARQIMDSVLERCGQGPEGGISLMERMQVKYPAVPIVFYTRKGSLSEGVKCIKFGAADVIQKPHPIRGQTEEALMKSLRQSVIDRFNMAMDNRWRILDKLTHKVVLSDMPANKKTKALSYLFELKEAQSQTNGEKAQRAFEKIEKLLRNVHTMAHIIAILQTLIFNTKPD